MVVQSFELRQGDHLGRKAVGPGLQGVLHQTLAVADAVAGLELELQEAVVPVLRTVAVARQTATMAGWGRE